MTSGRLNAGQTQKNKNQDEKNKAAYLFTALGGHLGAALPVAGVAAHCNKTDTGARVTPRASAQPRRPAMTELQTATETQCEAGRCEWTEDGLAKAEKVSNLISSTGLSGRQGTGVSVCL